MLRSFFNKKDKILGRYVFNKYDVYPHEQIMAGAVAEDPEICFSIKEAHSRNILHTAKPCQVK